MSTVTIRTLTAETDLPAVARFYAEAPDYWLLAEGAHPGPDKAAAFFSDEPPGCDPAASHRLGLFIGSRLSGVAQLSFGFPSPGDAYLGLMILGPWARGRGLGRRLLAEIERRAGGGPLYLGVLEVNPRGRAFWEREGFGATGVSRITEEGRLIHRLRKPAPAQTPC